MKKKLIAIVCTVLMLVGSVGVAKAATCSPHFDELQYKGEELGEDYSHEVPYSYRIVNGNIVTIYKTCWVCCVTEEYEYVCVKCNQPTEGGCFKSWECHSWCRDGNGNGDFIVDVEYY